MTEELRVAIRYSTTDVPGLPSDRARQVANDFALWKLSRQFSYEQDYIHCSSEFDSDASKAVWILCDFNVRDRRSDVNDIPTQFWKVDYGNIRSASFNERPTRAKQFTNRHPWGGSNNEWDYRLQRREAA